MSGAGCTIVFYHYVRDVERTRFPAIKALSIDRFAAQLDWLQSRFEIVDGATFERAVLDGRGFDHPTALLTFDDGFADHFEHVFPLLRSRGLGGIFFVVGDTLADPPVMANVHKTHFLLSRLGAERFAREAADMLAAAGVLEGDASREGIYRYDEAPDVRIKRMLNYEVPYGVADRVLEALFARFIGDSADFARSLYLTAGQIREMANGGMTFGFHTQSHPVLSRLTRDEQRRELGRGTRLVADLTRQATVSFCYPYGFPHTYNVDTLATLSECGYSMAFNTVRRAAVVGQEPRFELPRFDTRDVECLHEEPTGA